MAKVAKLHTGEILHFPTETPDDIVDKTVQKHLGITAPEDIPKEIETGPGMADLIDALDLNTAYQSNDSDRRHEELIKQKIHDAEIFQEVTNIKIQALDDLGEKITKAVEGLNPQLKDLVQNSGGVPDLIESVNNLSATILEAARVVISAFNEPRKIYHDASGVPNMIGPVGRSTPKGA